MPEPPGPPGLISSEPIRSCWDCERTRIIEMPKVWPFFGLFQSSGTWTFAQSYAIPVAPRPTTSCGTSGHGVQFAVPPDADCPEVLDDVPPESSGAKLGTVHPASATTIATGRATTRRARRGTGGAFRRLVCSPRG